MSINYPDTCAASTLTPRELEVVTLICKGYSNKKIAAELCIAEGTVENHLTRIYLKTGTNSRLEVFIWALRNGYINIMEILGT